MAERTRGAGDRFKIWIWLEEVELLLKEDSFWQLLDRSRLYFVTAHAESKGHGFRPVEEQNRVFEGDVK
jgi:hypothetical protein